MIFGPNDTHVKLTKLGFGQFLGLGTENYQIRYILNRKLGNFCDF